MSKKTKWLDKTLVESHISFCLCKNKKQYKKALKCLKQKIKDNNFLTNGSSATVHFFEDSTGRVTAIVCIDGSGYSKVEIYSLLVHEAVHIWQEEKLLIGEKFPSSEFEAYSIQAISKRLMEAYDA